MSTLFTGPLLEATVNELIPDHIRAQNPKYVEFIQAIARYLEEESRSGYILNRLARQRDIDLVDEEFLSELQSEIGSAIPKSFAASPRLFYKQLGDLYRSRGTPGSVESFFRLLYNDHVEIYFPKDDIFKPSDGTWFELTDDITLSPENYDPQYVYTAAASQTDFTGLDIGGGLLKYNKPVVYLDDVLQVVNVDYIPLVTPDYINERLDYHITFNTPMAGGETIEIYEGGLFSSSRSFVSNDKKIQDSFFYQKFSYVLKTGTDVSLWRNAFNRLIHPAGFIFFSEIFILIDLLDRIIPEIQPGWQTHGAPILIIPVNNPVPSLLSTSTTEFTVIVEPVQTNRFGPEDYLERIKFSLNGGIGGFADYTIEEVLELGLPFNMDAQITTQIV
jgi:hypothetical protein